MPYIHGGMGTIMFGSLMGDPQVKIWDTSKSVDFRLMFTNRQEGMVKSDWVIRCSCYGKMVDYAMYLKSGMRIAAGGHLRESEFVPTRGKNKGQPIKTRQLIVNWLMPMPPIEVWAWMMQTTRADERVVKEPETWEINDNPDVGF